MCDALAVRAPNWLAISVYHRDQAIIQNVTANRNPAGGLRGAGIGQDGGYCFDLRHWHTPWFECSTLRLKLTAMLCGIGEPFGSEKYSATASPYIRRWHPSFVHVLFGFQEKLAIRHKLLADRSEIEVQAIYVRNREAALQ